jgi:CMP-N-acetylneuraminic acid synthetase
MKIVSVILARGGSKGVPNKNIKDLCGKPLLSYSIEESMKSLSNETWVSSDSNKILEVSKKYGANTIKRPDELSLDNSKSEDALLHFANNVDFDYLVFIQPTSPFINYKKINEGIEMVTSGDYDSVFTAYKEHWIPRWDLNSNPVNWDINNRPMRQDVEEQYVENGAFYITCKNSLLESKLRYSGNIGVVEMSEMESKQIDTYNDFIFVKNIMKGL